MDSSPDSNIPDAMPTPPTETTDRTTDKKRRYMCHPPSPPAVVVPRCLFCVHAASGSHSRLLRLLLRTTGTARPNVGTACLQSMLCGGTEDESIQKLPVTSKEEKRCGMWKKARI